MSKGNQDEEKNKIGEWNRLGECFQPPNAFESKAQLDDFEFSLVRKSASR
jgi:hypothetical protein